MFKTLFWKNSLIGFSFVGESSFTVSKSIQASYFRMLHFLSNLHWFNLQFFKWWKSAWKFKSWNIVFLQSCRWKLSMKFSASLKFCVLAIALAQIQINDTIYKFWIITSTTPFYPKKFNWCGPFIQSKTAIKSSNLPFLGASISQRVIIQLSPLSMPSSKAEFTLACPLLTAFLYRQFK